MGITAETTELVSLLVGYSFVRKVFLLNHLKNLKLAVNKWA